METFLHAPGGPNTCRVAVVVGATRGAGRGIAAALGEAGATVGFTHIDGTHPDVWKFMSDEPAGLSVDLANYR
ncbi:hypothetical protein [Melittangium boletus]|uniref:Short-chain dehydrogenase n=1 Tax=Melittangium boletus DSM 14713 TaxID=1294270 RepID=A0A250I778_9BACT|nr:hypothetical protein [Melittangium boletus]ATB27625.1 short-chain dehydrogenase [Melittangium boletus DSM 14713]